MAQSSFRSVAAKMDNYPLRRLILIAAVDVAATILGDKSSSEDLKGLARKFLANPEIYAEKVYPIILRDERVDDDVPDSTLRIIIQDVFNLFL